MFNLIDLSSVPTSYWYYYTSFFSLQPNFLVIRRLGIHVFLSRQLVGQLSVDLLPVLCGQLHPAFDTGCSVVELALGSGQIAHRVEVLGALAVRLGGDGYAVDAGTADCAIVSAVVDLLCDCVFVFVFYY